MTPRAFVGDRRRVVFEYDPSSQSILCDGNYGQERDYVRHTPMTTWQIRIDDRMNGSLAASELEFSGFKGARFEFICDFVWVPL